MAVEIDGTSKGLLGAFAVFALGSGIASLVYGVLLLLQNINIEYHYGTFNFYVLSILLIVVGGLLIITVVLGIIGALKDISNLRVVTLILLFILFAIIAAVGVWGMVEVKTGRLERTFDATIAKFNEIKDSIPALKKQADYLHAHYNCCSAYPSFDTRQTGYIPESCCPGLSCDHTIPDSQRYFANGCKDVYFPAAKNTVYHLAILALVAAGLVLFALVFYAVVSQRARAGYAAVSRG